MKAAILYLPIIHKGHLEFCQRHNLDALYILGKSLLADFPLLERDLRALTPEQTFLEATALSLAQTIKILEKENLNELDSWDEIVISDDEVSRELKEKYFSTKNITVDTAFIRWSAVKAFSKLPPTDEEIISIEELDKRFMQQARDQAKRSSDWWRQVGAIIVKDEKVVAAGYNKHFPSEQSPNIDGDPRSNIDAGTHPELYTALHGESGLIAEAARKGESLDGARIYVTTFPCPNCAMLIAKAGIKEVYYADGYSALNSQEVLKQARVKIIRVKED